MYPNTTPFLPHPLKSYQTIATQTASPGQLVLMLYEGAIRFLERALAGFEHTDPLDFNQTINNNILCAQAIIHEMNANLNMEAGGEIRGGRFVESFIGEQFARPEALDLMRAVRRERRAAETALAIQTPALAAPA